MFGGALMKKVLIIEDDKNINEMLQELLSNNGYSQITTQSTVNRRGFVIKNACGEQAKVCLVQEM